MKTVRYNNDLLGNGAALASFSRAIATKDAYGNVVASGERRYDRTRGICELLSPTVALASTSANVYGNAGVDVDGSPLAVVYEANSVRIRVFKNSWSNVVGNRTYVSVGLTDSVPGCLFYPRAFLVCNGLILAGCSRSDSGVKVGVAILQTTDYGTTWTVVQDVDGNNSLPDLDPGHDRLAQFSLQNWMPCVRNGVAVAYGGVFTDYMYQSATNGGQCAVWLAVANESGAPVMKKLRLGATLTNVDTHHFHSGGMQFIPLSNGKVRCAYIVAVGDGALRNRIVLMWIDCEPDFSDWETATLNVNQEYHGGAVYEGGERRVGYQYTSCCVGPEEGTLLLTTDLNAGHLHKLTLPSESDDWSTVKAVVDRVGPYCDLPATGGAEDFAISCRDPITRTDFATVWRHKIISPPINIGAYSRDGENWSECFIPQNTAFTPYVFWFGQTICQPTDAAGIHSWPKPLDWMACRPLLLGHGTDNLVNVSSQWVEPDAGTTCDVLTANPDGTYTIPSGPCAGQVTRPPGNTEVFRITSTTGTRPLSRFLNAAAVMNPAITTGCVTVAILPISGDGTSITVDVSTEPEMTCGSHSGGRWKIYTLSETVSQTDNRPRIMLRCMISTYQVTTDCLVQVLNLHQDVDGGIGYPPPAHPNANASVHELEQIGPIAVGTRWSARLDAMIPECGWKAYPWHLLSIVDGNGDWTRVSWTADKTLVLTVSVDSVETTATLNTLYLFRWAKETQLRCIVSKTGDAETTLLVSCGGQAISTTTVAAALLDTSLTINLAANADQSEVSPMAVFGLRVWSPDDELTSPTGPMLSETDPDVNVLESAAATAQLATDRAAVATANSQFYGTILDQAGLLGTGTLTYHFTKPALETALFDGVSLTNGAITSVRTEMDANSTKLDEINTNAARLTATRAGYIDALATPANFKADLTGIAKTTDIPTTTINNSKTILDKFDSMIAEDS